jgi:hypothetical protein
LREGLRGLPERDTPPSVFRTELETNLGSYAESTEDAGSLEGVRRPIELGSHKSTLRQASTLLDKLAPTDQERRRDLLASDLKAHVAIGHIFKP